MSVVTNDAERIATLEQVALEGGGEEVVEVMKRVFALDGLLGAGRYLIRYLEAQYRDRMIDGPLAAHLVRRVSICVSLSDVGRR